MSRPNPTILMCPPDHFGIEYEINPWMHREKKADPAAAVRQWNALHATLSGLGAAIELIDPRPGLPDLVFTANAGVVQGRTFVPSRFRHFERQGETPVFCKWFAARGFEVAELPGGAAFEGAGDALYCGETLFAGYRHRTEVQAHQELGRLLGVQVLSLELVDPRFYHLDTCFCPLAPGVALAYPAAFDAYGQDVLRANVPMLIEVPEEDAALFACNAVAVGADVVHPPCPAVPGLLARHGFRSHPVELTEFLKAGGSAKCLTLRLDGEEAAPW